MRWSVLSGGAALLAAAGLLSACAGHPPALLRTVYAKSILEPGPDSRGLFKFSDWMPVRRLLHGSSPPVTYRSEGLAASLGLRNLFITFNGFWPERGALFDTCTFKVCGLRPPAAQLPGCPRGRLRRQYGPGLCPGLFR